LYWLLKSANFARRGSLRANRIQAQEKLSRPIAFNEQRQSSQLEDRLGRSEDRLARPEERLGKLSQSILSDNQLINSKPEKSIFPSFENLKV
jgi:hypothetical protein